MGNCGCASCLRTYSQREYAFLFVSHGPKILICVWVGLGLLVRGWVVGFGMGLGGWGGAGAVDEVFLHLGGKKSEMAIGLILGVFFFSFLFWHMFFLRWGVHIADSGSGRMW